MSGQQYKGSKKHNFKTLPKHDAPKNTPQSQAQQSQNFKKRNESETDMLEKHIEESTSEKLEDVVHKIDSLSEENNHENLNQPDQKGKKKKHKNKKKNSVDSTNNVNPTHESSKTVDTPNGKEEHKFESSNGPKDENGVAKGDDDSQATGITVLTESIEDKAILDDNKRDVIVDQDGIGDKPKENAQGYVLLSEIDSSDQTPFHKQDTPRNLNGIIFENDIVQKQTVDHQTHFEKHKLDVENLQIDGMPINNVIDDGTEVLQPIKNDQLEDEEEKELKKSELEIKLEKGHITKEDEPKLFQYVTEGGPTNLASDSTLDMLAKLEPFKTEDNDLNKDSIEQPNLPEDADPLNRNMSSNLNGDDDNEKEPEGSTSQILKGDQEDVKNEKDREIVLEFEEESEEGKLLNILNKQKDNDKKITKESELNNIFKKVDKNEGYEEEKKLDSLVDIEAIEPCNIKADKTETEKQAEVPDYSNIEVNGSSENEEEKEKENEKGKEDEFIDVSTKTNFDKNEFVPIEESIKLDDLQKNHSQGEAEKHSEEFKKPISEVIDSNVFHSLEANELSRDTKSEPSQLVNKSEGGIMGTFKPDDKQNHKLIIISPEELVKKVNELKASADGSYEKGQKEEAIKLYQEALDVLIKDKQSLPRESAEIVIYVKILYNISTCYFKLQKFQETIFYCQKVVEIDPSYIKAYYRSGQALKALDRIEDALQVLKIGLPMAKNSLDIEMQRSYILFYNELVTLNNEMISKMQKVMKPLFSPNTSIKASMITEEKEKVTSADVPIQCDPQENTTDFDSWSKKSKKQILFNCLIAGLVVGGLYVGATKTKEAPIGFGLTAISAYIYQKTKTKLVKASIIAAALAGNLVIYKMTKKN